MPPEADQFNALADTFFCALEAGDVDAAIGCYAADARIWHNFDQLTMSPAENAVQIRGLFDGFPTRKYLQVRRSYLPQRGLLQQHIFHLVRADGRVFDWPGCIVFEMKGNKITLLEEYVDVSGIA
jgi:ketosteroid isomerase-like protein